MRADINLAQMHGTRKASFRSLLWEKIYTPTGSASQISPWKEVRLNIHVIRHLTSTFPKSESNNHHPIKDKYMTDHTNYYDIFTDIKVSK